MKLQRGFTRFVAALTAISLLLPTAVFALSGAETTAPLPQDSINAARNTIAPPGRSVITLQMHDLLGLLNGEIGGIPQFGLLAGMGISRIGEVRSMASNVRVATVERNDVQYVAVSLPARSAAGLPSIALAGNAASEILLKADGQASNDFKLTSLSSMPRLIETSLQTLSARGSGAITIRNLLDQTLAAAPEGLVLKENRTGTVHQFGSVLAAAKPTVDSAPFGRALTTVVFAQLTSELTQRLGASPEGSLSVTPAWAAILLELLMGLAGLAAIVRARRSHSARQALLVFLKCEQRE